MKRMLASFLISICAVGAVAAQIQKTGSCDRACLEGIADRYLTAMVAHDASKAPLAEDLIFTENTIKLPPTEGLWFTASGLGDFKFYVCDLQEGQVAWTGIVKEHNKPVLFSVRLKVVNRRITEAESIVVRDVNERNLANLKTPPPSTMPFADMFKTKNGKIRGILAFGTMLPYGIGDGWSGPLFK
jgi:hypothetical protein